MRQKSFKYWQGITAVEKKKLKELAESYLGDGNTILTNLYNESAWSFSHQPIIYRSFYFP